MNVDQLLRETFAEHEYLAPDSASTLRGIHQAIDGAPRTSRVVVLAATATVIAIAIGGALVSGREGGSGSTTGGAVGQGRTAPSSTAPSSLPVNTPTAVPASDDLTIGAGWLPEGREVQEVGSNGTYQFRSYAIVRGSRTTQITLGLAGGSTLPTAYKRGAPHDLTIAGRPAREWSVDGWYYVAVLRAGGQVASVDVNRDNAPAGELQAAGRHVAAQLQYDRHVPLNPQFRLGYVPAGQAIDFVTVDRSLGTSYGLTPPVSANASQVGIELQLLSTSDAGRGGKPAPPTIAGRPVQGHATRVQTGSSVPILTVQDAVDGHPIVITGGYGASTLAEVYKIAEGLILPN